MFLNPIINYDTKYNFLHHHPLRFIHRFLVSDPSVITQNEFASKIMSKSHPLKKNKIPSHHIHIFRERLLEYRVCTPSEKWCWKTFLQDGITEHRIFGFVSIMKSSSGHPPTIKLFTNQALVAL